MNKSATRQVYKVFVLLLAAFLALACAILPAALTSNGTPAAVKTNAATGAPNNPSKAVQGIPTPAPNPLDWLLGLRQVKIDQTTVHPDGSTYRLAIEIDSSGNMRVTETRPVKVDPGVLTQNMDIKQLSGDETLYVLVGKAYQVDSSDPGWKTTPVDDHFVQTLSDRLNGADGPGLWLNVLGDEAFKAAGQANVGGFAANKYNVNGQFNKQTISGTIWIEPKSKALVKVDLNVPAVLMDPSDKSGVLKITLSAQQTAVDPIRLPDIPKTTNAPTQKP